MTDILELEKEIIKKYGKDVFVSGEHVTSENKMIIPVSPSINSIIGGGVPEGSWVGLAGPSGCGKTTMALKIAANAQKEEYGSRDVFYLDAEGRLKKRNLEGIAGLDISKVRVIRSSEDKHLSGEEYSTIATNIIKKHKKAIIIVDSVSSLCPSAEITEDVSGQIRSTNPRIMASFCRQNAGVVPVMNSIVITIHHLINNTSGWGEKLVLDGGVKIGYQADVKLITKNKPKAWMKDGIQIGQIVEWECIKCAIGQPFGETESYIRYGHGLDDAVEAVNMAIELSIIRKGGAWYYLPFITEDTKFNGQQAVYDFMAENPQWINYLNEEILKFS